MGVKTAAESDEESDEVGTFGRGKREVVTTRKWSSSDTSEGDSHDMITRKRMRSCADHDGAADSSHGPRNSAQVRTQCSSESSSRPAASNSSLISRGSSSAGQAHAQHFTSASAATRIVTSTLISSPDAVTTVSSCSAIERDREGSRGPTSSVFIERDQEGSRGIERESEVIKSC